MTNPNDRNQEPLTQAIGSLTEAIVQNAAARAMTSPDLLSNSKTTALQTARSTQTGTLPSTTGLATLRDLVTVQPANPPTATELNRQLLASLKQDAGPLLVLKAKYNSEYDVAGYIVRLDAFLPSGWCDALVHFTKPSGGAFVAAEMARLRMLTVAAKDTEQDLEAKIAVFSEELMSYPNDIVKEVCREWAKNTKFFPNNLKEIKEKCESLMLPRRALAAAAAKPEQQLLVGADGKAWGDDSSMERRRLLR